MSEHVTAAECRDSAASRNANCMGDHLHRAAATIEALEARVAELESRPPSSPDTDDARDIADEMAECNAPGWGDLVRDLCAALDAARAECERLRAENAALRDNNDTLASLAASARLSRGSGPGQ